MSATGVALEGYRERVLLVSVLVACRAPLPAELEFDFEAPPVAPGLGVGYTDQLVAVPEGMVVVGATTTLLLRHGSARPAMNAAMLVDDEAVCGDPMDADRFLSVWGSCEAWLGLTLSGNVWMGSADGRLRADPPVGEVYAVDESSGTVFVAGKEGVAWTHWQDPARGAPDRGTIEWTSVPTPSAEMIAGYQGLLGVSVWYASDEAACHTDGGAPVCFPVKGVTGLTAGRAGAWVAADGEGRPLTVERGIGA